MFSTAKLQGVGCLQVPVGTPYFYTFFKIFWDKPQNIYCVLEVKKVLEIPCIMAALHTLVFLQCKNQNKCLTIKFSRK